MAKEIVRIGTTAGLSKDVVDLLEKKLAILTGELSVAQRSFIAILWLNMILYRFLFCPTAIHGGSL